jgi:hypothetical protein
MPKNFRVKLSTTIGAQNLEFLKQLVKRGQAATLAEAVDIAITRVRRLENRSRLAQATARYFEQLDSDATREESALAHDLMSRSKNICE